MNFNVRPSQPTPSLPPPLLRIRTYVTPHPAQPNRKPPRHRPQRRTKQKPLPASRAHPDRAPPLTPPPPQTPTPYKTLAEIQSSPQSRPPNHPASLLIIAHHHTLTLELDIQIRRSSLRSTMIFSTVSPDDTLIHFFLNASVVEYFFLSEKCDEFSVYAEVRGNRSAYG